MSDRTRLADLEDILELLYQVEGSFAFDSCHSLLRTGDGDRGIDVQNLEDN
jgi:predicted SAM-dependent methyltransferase